MGTHHRPGVCRRFTRQRQWWEGPPLLQALAGTVPLLAGLILGPTLRGGWCYCPLHRQGTDAQHGDAAAKPDSGHKATALHCTYRPHVAHLSGTRCLRVHPRNRPECTRGEIQIQGCEISDAGLWAHM